MAGKTKAQQFIEANSFGGWGTKKQAKVGRPSNLIPGWGGITKKIKSRDGYECRICGACQRTRTLHVHHIDWDRANNRLTNLVLLCNLCHKSVHDSNYRPGQDDDYPAPWGEHPHCEEVAQPIKQVVVKPSAVRPEPEPKPDPADHVVIQPIVGKRRLEAYLTPAQIKKKYPEYSE